MTITVRLPTKQEAELRSRLEAEGIALSDFVREAIAEKLGREATEAPTAYERGRHLFGRHGSGRGNLSTDRKAILDEMLRAKHGR